MTLEEAGVILDALVAAFPRMTMSLDTAQLYARFLADASLDHAIAATAKLIARGKGFPLISDLREAIAIEGGKGPPDTDRAFGEVRRKVGSVGRYRTPTWSHPAIAAAVDSIGWREICDEEHPPSLRKHFAEAYRVAQLRATDPAHVMLVASVTAEVKKRLVGASRLEELKA